MLFGYRGGIRPVSRKDRTRRKTLCDLDIMPQELTLFLQQSTGAPAQPLVVPHQRVKEGECIAEAMDGGVSVHASLAGEVVAIEDRPDARGKLRPAIVLQVTEGEKVPPVQLDWDNITPDEMIGLCDTFGLVEMVGEPVPMSEKILDARGKVETIIINGTEGEPYLTATHRLGLERGRDLIAGGRLLARIIGVRDVIFATTGDQLTVIERLERDLRRKEVVGGDIGRAMEIRTIPSRYPLYDDKQIILATLKREVPPEATAVEAGCQVFSLAAVCALGRAFIKGEPVTRVTVTVSGLAVARPRNLWAPVGVSLHNLLENCNGITEEPAITLLGGLIRGQRVTKLKAPVEKHVTGLLCLLEGELPKLNRQDTCLQCGSCIEVCPMRLCPVFIFRATVGGQVEKLETLHPQDCIGCAACASVCPSHIPLNRMMAEAKHIITARLEERSHENS